ncbi:hypothetical protein OIU34_17245 [Pararhizobium sp. BT-229]|uniref:hypothetical protein n=1 Tax=Pararhizobium sp. BT-229 TaxID=2986923 RepID=UPI0021F78CE2|nr:hypothetical protein [Pararhizobium sp. BT-229]MCV9963648.1 hypothetical protein [Pararhizobium sp. BT-229]
MHIKLPYAFQVTGKVPGTRKMDRVIACDWLTVNVATAGNLDAPVCLSWTREAAYNFFEDHALGTEGRVDIRTFDGNFYRPLTQVNDSFKAADVAGRVLIDYQPHSDKAEELPAAQIAFVHFPERYARPEFAGETFTNEQDIVEALTKKAESLLFVDGTVWERCPEPVLVIEEDFHRHHTIFISPAFPDKYQPGSREEYFTFAIDELEEAVAFSRNRPQAEYIDITISAAIDASTPELLSRHHVEDDVLRHAEKILKRGGYIELNQASPEYIRTWTAFSASLAAAKLTPEETEIQLLIDDWTKFADENNLLNGAPEYDYDRGIAYSLQARFADRTMEPEAIFSARPKR